MTAETSMPQPELRRRLLDRLLDEWLLDERLFVDWLRPVDERRMGSWHSVEAWRAGVERIGSLRCRAINAYSTVMHTTSTISVHFY